jgi:hypothetical protein
VVWGRLTNQSRRTGRLLLIVAAISLLSMPIDYRGGAELPHAHALFQFWMSGDADAFDHHGPSHDENHEHDQSDGHDTYSLPMSSRNAVPDTPTVSNMGSPAEMGSVLALSLLLTTLLFAEGRRLLIATWNRTLVGILPSPERPPPRAVSARSFCELLLRNPGRTSP